MLTPFQNKAKERSVVILLAINQFSRDQPHSLYVGKAQSAFIHKQRIVGPFLQYRIWEQEDMPCRNLWTWWKMTFFTRLLTSYWSPGQSRAKPARPRSQQHFRSILEKKKKKKEKRKKPTTFALFFLCHWLYTVLGTWSPILHSVAKALLSRREQLWNSPASSFQ